MSALDFGKQPVTVVSEPLSLMIRNSGTAELEITRFIHPSVFSISPSPTESAPLRIGVGQMVPVYVSFTPRTLGMVEGRLDIISNAVTAAPSVSLKGIGIDGRMSLTPSSLSFSGVDVGAPGVARSVTLTNSGEYKLTVTGVDPPEDAAFTVSGLPPGTVLQPGEDRPFTVTFKPVRRGYAGASTVIRSDSVLNPTLHLSMDGTGLAAAVEVLPADLSFGRANVGVPTSQNLSIKNTGERELYVSNIAFVDAPAGAPGAALDFGVGGSVTFPLAVKPSESVLVPILFTPQALGLRQARAIVYTNDKAVEVNLQGEGTSPVLKLSSPGLEFGSVRVGSPSAPRVLRLTNTGTGVLTVRSLVVGGADVASFLLTSPALPFSLVPGATSEIAVTFKPEAERVFAAQLVVESNDTYMPGVVVPMSGVGVRQQLQLSTPVLEFGRQLIHYPSSPRTVRVINNSDSPVTLTAVTVEGAGASRFSVMVPPLPLSLGPRQEQEVMVRFTPSSEAEVDCVLKFSFSEMPDPLGVELNGKGIPAVLSVMPTPLDFGAVRVGGAQRVQPLTLTNLSSDPIILAAPEVTYATGVPFLYDEALVRDRTLEPGMSIIVPVGYQPMVETLSETQLSFGTTLPPKPRSAEVQLEGRAVQRFLSVDRTRLEFGQVAAGTQVAPRDITITNHSSQPQRVVVKLKNLEGTPFSLEAKALAEPLPPGGSATISVAFEPQTEGEAENEVEVWLQGETEAEALIPVTGSLEAPEQAGGCACDSTSAGSAGMLALLALVGLGSRRRRNG
ncbi:hypothetical protein BO221_08330 [Archangium sp. Cb G35]|nr:hypothetical protein BO221_08330 [Archangium sp. Cb G35]